MEWGGAEIGWQYSSSLYREHSYSESSSALLGCLYSSTYSATVFRLDCKSLYDIVTLGECITVYITLYGREWCIAPYK